MQLFHHYHSFSLHKFMSSEFWLFESSVWLHVVGRSLVAVFIPILLLTANYSIGEVMVYYFLFNLFDVPLNFFARWLIRKIGARMVIVLGILGSIAFFVTLFNLTPNNWLLLGVLALFAALYDSLYWVAHIYYFMESSKKRHSASRDMSILYIVRKIGTMLAPAIGAAILIFFDQKVLIVFSIIFLLISIWPLVKMGKTHDKPTGKQLSFREFFKNKKDLKDYFSLSLYGLHSSAEGIIWPIFIFVLFETFESVAVVPIIVSFTTIVFTYFTGKIKKRDRSNTLMIGSFLVAIVWILRLLLESSIFYYASIFLIGLFSVLITIPVDTNILEQGQKKDALSAATYRNTFSMGLRVFLYGLLALMVSVFDMSFMVAATAMFVIIGVTLFFNRIGVGPKELLKA